MDWSEIKRLADEARALSIEIDGRTFRLRVPTEIQARIAYARGMDAASDAPSAARLIFTDILLRDALIGWDGVMLSDLGVSCPDDSHAPWSKQAAELLLQERMDWRDALSDKMMDAYNERNKRLDEAKKN